MASRPSPAIAAVRRGVCSAQLRAPQRLRTLGTGPSRPPEHGGRSGIANGGPCHRQSPSGAAPLLCLARARRRRRRQPAQPASGPSARHVSHSRRWPVLPVGLSGGILRKVRYRFAEGVNAVIHILRHPRLALLGLAHVHSKSSSRFGPCSPVQLCYFSFIAGFSGKGSYVNKIIAESSLAKKPLYLFTHNSK